MRDSGSESPRRNWPTCWKLTPAAPKPTSQGLPLRPSPKQNVAGSKLKGGTGEREMNPLESDEQHFRIITALAAMLAGCIVIGILTVALPAPQQMTGEIYVSALLLDRGSGIYPLTIQNLMWLMFFFGLGELWIRFRRADRELDQLLQGILPDDDTTMFRGKDLVPIYRSIMKAKRAPLLPPPATDSADRAAVSDQPFH